LLFWLQFSIAFRSNASWTILPSHSSKLTKISVEKKITSFLPNCAPGEYFWN
jgi:hypothetical protein